MKTFLVTLIAVLPAISFAKTTIDSSQAAQGTITITVTNMKSPLENDAAAKIAYDLFAKKNTSVINEIKKAQAAAKENYDERNCGTLDALKLVVLANWDGGRPSNQGEIGSEANFLAIQPVSCDGVGTGLFGGVAENAMFAINVVNSITNVFDDNSKQVITITLKGNAQVTIP